MAEKQRQTTTVVLDDKQATIDRIFDMADLPAPQKPLWAVDSIRGTVLAGPFLDRSLAEHVRDLFKSRGGHIEHPDCAPHKAAAPYFGMQHADAKKLYAQRTAE